MERTVSSTYRDGTCVTRRRANLLRSLHAPAALQSEPAALAAILSRMRRSIAAARSIVDTSLRFDDQKRTAGFSHCIDRDQRGFLSGNLHAASAN